MNSLSRHLRASSVSSLIRGCGGIKCVSRFSSQSNGYSWGSSEQQAQSPRASGGSSGDGNSNSDPNAAIFQNFTHSSFFRENSQWRNSKFMDFARGVTAQEGGSLEQQARFPWASRGSFGEGSSNSAPNAPNFMNFTRSALFRDNGGWGNAKSMDLVKEALEEDGKRSSMGYSPFYRRNVEMNAEVVHIKMLPNNTFVTVTDSKGNVKCKASSGCLPELKGGPKLSRYAAEATAEHIGRKARTMGLKSVVVKVNGFIHFKKKRQAIVAFKEGFNSSSSDQNPIVFIEDTTRRAHNGCRLPRKRRV